MSVPPLLALHGFGHDIALVVTRADTRRARGGAAAPSPVKLAALELGLPVSHDMSDIVGSGVELGVVVAFGRIIPAGVLAAVPMINVHFSLLPRWRGAAPVERAILAGDEVTGVCLMDVAAELDTGDVYACEKMPIGADTTAAELRDELVARGTALLVAGLDAGLGEPVPQEGEATYAQKITVDDLRLDWSRAAVELHRVVRLGRAFTTFRGQRFKIHAAGVVEHPRGAEPGTLREGVIVCGQGALDPIEVQPAGSSRMSWEAYANGSRPRDGERFGDMVGDDG